MQYLQYIKLPTKLLIFLNNAHTIQFYQIDLLCCRTNNAQNSNLLNNMALSCILRSLFLLLRQFNEFEHLKCPVQNLIISAVLS